MPEGVETGWLPIASQHIGNGYGLFWGPNIGDPVEFGYQEADVDTPRIMGRLHSDTQSPPVSAGPASCFVWLRHQPRPERECAHQGDRQPLYQRLGDDT
jgi:uncharacterized protein involved in type VI secretion and phage assembly